MSIPVNRLKILAFIFSWAVAGFFGAIYAAILTAAVSTNFSIGLLITIYAVIILGGLGSIAGVIVGAIIINCIFVFLEPQTDHPAAQALALLRHDHPPDRAAEAVVQGRGRPRRDDRERVRRPRRRRGDGRLGVDVRQDGRPARAGSRTGSSSRRCDHGNFDNILYIGLVAAIVLVASLKGWWRIIALGPTLYLTAVVWENVLSENPGVTAFILFGAMLVGLMVTRPQGLLGRREWRSSDDRDSGAHCTDAAARAQQPLDVVRRPEGDRRPRPRRQRVGDRQRDRPERRRQDDAVQPDHRDLPARRGRDPAGGRRASSVCRHTRSTRPGLPERSRRCGSSST